jgi:predicted metal-binding membrane protein
MNVAAASGVSVAARPRLVDWRPWSVPVMVVGAWLVLLILQATGAAPALHHHALIEDGPSLWLAIPIFLAGWLVMVVAMMVPASLPTVRILGSRAAAVPGRAPFKDMPFLGSFVAVWLAFGLVAFLGDVALHHLVDTTPGLADRPWLIEASILAIAGSYQFSATKRRSLAACRHPGDPAGPTLRAGTSAAGSGLRHGAVCLAGSWALMLLMFGQGFSSLSWMLGLTGLMAYETMGRHGDLARVVAGGALLFAALATVSG